MNLTDLGPTGWLIVLIMLALAFSEAFSGPGEP